MASKTALAWHNFTHDKVKMGVSIAGVTFAVVLMFMQLGFLEAVGEGAVTVLDQLDFDVCLRSPEYDFLTDARSIPTGRLAHAERVKGVASTTPLLVGVFSWRNPRSREIDPNAGQQRAILALGMPVGQPVFRDPRTQQAIHVGAAQYRGVLIDTKTRPEFGPADGRQFGPKDIGQSVEVNGVALTVTGTITCGAGLSAGGDMVVSRETFLTCLPVWPPDRCSLGLIRLDPNLDDGERARVLQQLKEAMPDDVEVLTRAQVLARERGRWVWQSNYGLIFLSGVVVAALVGAVIVYQVLSSEVAGLMPEYATLKAMGYRNGFLCKVLVQQSVMLAMAAYVVGIGLAWCLLRFTSWLAQISVSTTRAHLIAVLIVSLTMCCLSGVLAVRKAFKAQPAELF